ncbi:amino acid adenylation domain-containing protein [Sphingomonas qomolangmaensis]|uniref:Amino acid adenylation domain-containing protein n=1 Tax=Sphingomonas qomolangmaensis TaxID=2918765 RepID=A0ABY5L823_9SPHN|nr:amino acid adenylation domain-containing protein [Sphingomonas qomolangmaensis]UUL82311.1 amino acid adenylation domain-containing protein [Sphingomonas qomolangmaensis]
MNSARLADVAPIAADTGEDCYAFPASFAQRRLWFLHQLHPDSPAYSMVAAFRVTGALDIDLLERSLSNLVARHETLRTRFGVSAGEPLQLIAPEATIAIARIDLAGTDAEARAQAWLAAEARRPFDLERGPLLRAAVLRLGDDAHILSVSMHHIVSDGWSLGVLMRELSELYAAHLEARTPALEPLAVQYADYSAWQHDWLQGEVLDAQIAYWRDALEGVPTMLDLPLDRPRAARQRQRGAQHRLRIDPALAERLRGFARGEGATLYMLLLAGFQALLSRYTGQQRLLVGSPIAGRTQRETEGLIGFFVNTLVLRGDLGGDPGLAALLAQVRETTLSAFAHQDVPFEKLVEALAPQRDLSRSPLFQAMFILQNAPAGELALGDARLEPVAIDNGTAKFDLTLALEEAGDGGIEGYCEYDRDLFDRETIARFADHYVRLLSRALDDPAMPIARIDFLSDAERHRLLHDWNDTKAAYLDKTLHQLFEEQAAATPEATAVAGPWGALTYRALEARANRLARLLIDRGAGPETTVALLIEPGAELIVALLAVLKSGAAYVPIDPGFPARRIDYIVDQSGAIAKLTDRGDGARGWLDIAALEALAAPYPATPPHVAAGPGNLAYVIYTSGSTGRPKGVAVEHRQVSSYAHAVTQRFGFAPDAHYALLQPIAVDSSNTMLMPWLCFGGTLHVLPRRDVLDPQAIARYFGDAPMDVLKIAPSHLAELLRASDDPRLLPRAALVLGGEASRWDWLRQAVLPRLPEPARAYIHYGPTETTVGVLTNAVDPDESASAPVVPLGRPLGNVDVHVVDPKGALVPIGVTGEIRIGGDSVARGYLGRAGLTAERFVPDSHARQPGARAYRTGDLARRLADGRIAILGRADTQMKIGGYRIEPGEIETVLLDHPAVATALVVGRDTAAGDRILVAYHVAHAGAGDATDLRAWLRERLPDYMVPSAFVPLEAFPLSAQGKVDLNALPPPCAAAPAAPSALLGPVEQRLAQLWRELLGIETLGRDDSFFELGGYSLLVIRMLARVRRQERQAIAPVDFLDRPTIGGLADLLGAQPARRAGLLIPLQRLGSAPPLVCVHPIGGDVLGYAGLAQALGDHRPMLALRSPPGGAGATIEAIAERYVGELLRSFPDARCLLGGWSFGGLVAFEMVRQLEARGLRTAGLVLLDTHLREPDRAAPDDEDLLTRFAGDFAATLGRDTVGDAATFAALDRRARRTMLSAELFAADLIEADTDAALDAHLSTFAAHADAAARYRPGRIGQAITLFAADRGTGLPRLGECWANRTTGALRGRLVAGDHYSMLRPPHVAGLAAALAQSFPASDVARRVA